MAKSNPTSLLEKARGIEVKMKKSGKRIKITPELIELAIAWVNDEISITTVNQALGFKIGLKVYTWMALALKEYIKKKEIK